MVRQRRGPISSLAASDSADSLTPPGESRNSRMRRSSVARSASVVTGRIHNRFMLSLLAATLAVKIERGGEAEDAQPDQHHAYQRQRVHSPPSLGRRE